MKFLHTADWHIGRKLNGFSLLEEQRDIFFKMLDVAIEEEVDAIVVAGDLYDRSVPSVEAVELLNEMMIEMNLVHHFPVLAISGNHDSPTRLATATPWLKEKDFYLYTTLKQALTPVVIKNTQFFLLPYVEPVQGRLYFNDENLKTIPQVVERVVSEMELQFDAEKHHVLVGHFFAAGSSKTDSETPLEVGGLSSVPLGLFDAFDYVALGHLHYQDAIKHHDKVKYSGSLLKYSLSEKHHTKGCRLVDISGEKVNSHFIPLEPMRDVKVLSGEFAQLMDYEFYKHLDLNHYYHIVLKDKLSISQALSELRNIYPNMISLEREKYFKEVSNSHEAWEEAKKKLSPKDLVTNYYEEVTETTLTSKQLSLLEEIIIEINKEK